MSSRVHARLDRGATTHQSLMDAHGERHGEEAGGGLNEQAHRLQRVPHDEFGLGIRPRLLIAGA